MAEVKLTHPDTKDTVTVPSERSAAILEKSGWKRAGKKNEGTTGTASDK